MRNLKNIHHSVFKFPSSLSVTATAWDVATDKIICAFGPANNNLLELKRVHVSNKDPGADVSRYDNDWEYIASWDAPSPLPDLEYDKVLNLQYFADTLIACLVLAGGDIVIVREQPQPGEEKIEIVGSIDAGITAADWSPDEELLAITTRAGTLLYMTRDFESIVNITFTPDDLKASKHVSVGWGKSETQFKGKRVKALRDPTMPEVVDQGVLSPFDTNDVIISWRGDGAYLAVNSVEPKKRRVIRVYSREGTLDSVSEPVDGLEAGLSWQPAGNLMASIQRLKDRIDVVSFERNGLRHGQFSLRLGKEEMETVGKDIQLKWNVDSSVLAVCFMDRVQLWTMGNYHYYLKQEVMLPELLAFEKGVDYLRWHPEKSLCFTLTSQLELVREEYIFAVAKGPTVPPNDYGVVAVIDGSVLKLTPLRLSNVPPPMALHELSLPHNAIDVAVSHGSSTHPVRIAVLHAEGLSIYDWDPTGKPPTPPTLTCQLPISSSPSTTRNQQLCCISEDRMAVLQSQLQGSMLQVISIGPESLGTPMSSSPYKAIKRISISTGYLGRGNLCILLETNQVVILRLANTGNLISNDAVTIPVAKGMVSTPWIEVVELPVNKLTNSNGDLLEPSTFLVFGLSTSGSLYANGRLLIRNCTSFLVTAAHLIFTTTQHLLKFVHMSDLEGLEIPPDAPETDERCRSVERGAKLVSVMPTASALVLQMPRGNLETIYPRALVLAGIRRNITAKQYKKGFLACRNHRVDMNILHDHDPQQFMSSVGLFIDQIKKVEWIDLFLSQLKEEDVSQTMYKETLQKLPSTADINTKDMVAPNGVDRSAATTIHPNRAISKINRVCDAFLEALKGRQVTNLQNIVTAHVCKAPPDLDAGLSLVAKFRGEDMGQAEKAVEHICFLADVNRLYEHALGLYDLDLTLLDPREYLPFLQNLQEMSKLRRQYAIDDHLGRYSKALLHLYELDAFDELKAYTIKHKLYKEALSLYRYQPARLQETMRLYADHLNGESKYKEAGLAYEYLTDYPSATEAYRLVHMWRESLSCATLIPLPAPLLRTLANTLADTLIESKDHASAATIHADYLSSPETAARLFCKAYLFAEATRLIALHARPDLLDSVLDPGLVDGLAGTTELLADCKAQLNAQVPRLRELRAKKAEDPLAFFDGVGAVVDGVDVPDNISLAPTDVSTTGGSLFTRYTNRSGTGTLNTQTTRRTSKGRRREERKRARGKKGSVYEEEYLVGSVGRLVEKVNGVGEEVERLVVGLVRRGMREQAMAVEAAMAEVVGLCKGCVAEVFETEVEEKREGVAVAGGEVEGRPGGGDGVFWDSVEEKARKREAPVVKDFGKLSLLGG